MSRPSVLARAPAKINLALRVGPRRPDGFHDLATVYQAIDLHDEVLATQRPDAVVSVETTDLAGRPVAGVVDNADHLGVRAADALRRRYGVQSGVHLRVRKDIPVAAGLAGGSADAAATLVACTELWELGIDSASLLEVGAGLGSDVPFALLGGTALGSGRGERVATLTTATATTWVLVSSAPGLATPAVYGRTDAIRAGRELPAPAVDDELLAAVGSGDTGLLAAVLHNDLQPAALELRPGLTAVLNAGRAAGAAAGLVSGSGPTVLLLVRDGAEAVAVSAAVWPVAIAALTGAQMRTVCGPVAGAAVVAGA